MGFGGLILLILVTPPQFGAARAFFPPARDMRFLCGRIASQPLTQRMASGQTGTRAALQVSARRRRPLPF